MKKTLKAALSLLIALVTVFACIPVGFAADSEAIELIGDVQETVPELHISIDSGYSLDTIHASKEEKIRAHVSVSGAWDSSYNMSSTGVEMKTRGNSTFGYMKKPYQIKFDSNTDMFGMGKAKKWVLLANYVDGSFIRNKIVFDIAEEMGMAYVCKSVFVDLYIDGNYIGVYQLCEKVEIGDNRVPLESDLGVMVEMESAKRVAEEDFWFTTSVSGKPFVYKEYNTDFEEASAEEVAAVRSYLEERINTIENELYNNGKDWEKLESLIDVDSFVQFYLINELAMNVDATLASTYFYIDGPDDVLHMGPLWDYDRAFGSYDYYESGYEQGAEADFLKNIIDCSDEYRAEWFKMLFQYPQFCKRVNEIYGEIASRSFDPERIGATIDAYQEVLHDSLMRNYVDEGWAIFHNISEAEFFSNRADAAEYLEFTVDYIKNNIASRKAYLDKAYGRYMPVLFYQQNGGRVYSGGSMTDASDMKTFAMSLDGIIDGSIAYKIIYGSNATAAEGRNGEKVSADAVYMLQIALEGNVANYYSVQYRAFYNGSWSSWKADGTNVGARGKSINRIQVRLIEKAPVEMGSVTFDSEGYEAISAVVGNVVTLPAPSEKISGWYESADFSGEPVTEITVSKGTTMVYGKPANVTLMPGDLNGDEKLTAIDSNLAKRFIAGGETPTDEQFAACDVEADGKLNSKDSNKLSRMILGMA